MSQPDTEPVCCGQPMVAYMGGWAYECADSYFALLDDGAIADDGATPPTLNDDAPTHHVAQYAHLLETRIVADW